MFDLRDHSANVMDRYDFCRDIAKLEPATESGMTKSGYAVFLTNDPQYWNVPASPDTNDTQCRLHDSRDITGILSWAPSITTTDCLVG